MRSDQLWFLPLAALFVSACVDGTNAQGSVPESEFQELASGVYTDNGIYTRKQTKVISTQSEYDDELLNYTSSAPADIDFTEGKVLLADMGQRNTGGYSIEVRSINVAEQYVTVNIRLTKPGQNCVTTDAITNPYQFVFIPTQKEILVTENLVIHQCPD
jgi:hypothetical protein